MKIVDSTPTRLYVKFPYNQNISIITNLIGKKYNRLTVIALDSTQKGHTMWLCKCDCGNKTKVESYNLKTGHSKSCGCEKVETLFHRSHKAWKNLPEYGVYNGMLSRCNNQNSLSFKDYGGRGIKVCELWAQAHYGFLEFYKSMGKRPSAKHEIDRIDNDGDYSPDNCRWVIKKINANNKRTSIVYTYNDKTLTIAQWAEEVGIKPGTLYYRYHRGDRGKELFRSVEIVKLNLKP